ncbi:adhesion G protein-coupled receptor E3-like isoform X2 [Anas acuta]|uniref:adhesion G protein-coupled receptor E3-like isoform X2 n=1 Tax=Anas acuta TaxID=28680 RepID=UPI0035C8CAD3
MGSPHLAACLRALCCLLSLLHAAAGTMLTLQCDNQSCSASSCCLGLPTARSGQLGGEPWVCGCPPGLIRTIQDSSVVCDCPPGLIRTIQDSSVVCECPPGLIRSTQNSSVCECPPGLVCSIKNSSAVCGCPPKMICTIQDSSIVCQEACDVTNLEPVKKLCEGKKGFPLCTKLLNSTKGPKETCANTTEETLQEVLSELQSVVRNQQDTQHGANLTALLIQSTEAIVLQAAHGGIQELNTTFMQAETKLVDDACPIGVNNLELKVEKEELNIRCTILPKDTVAVAFIVYKNLEDVLNNVTEMPPGVLISRVVGGTVGNDKKTTFSSDFFITLQHNESLQEGMEAVCVSWKPDDSKGQWTPEGCRRTGGDNRSSICACNHFSSFAIIMAIREGNESHALRVLSICLFIADLLFLVAEPLTSNKPLCKIIAGCLHYFFLASFSWMLLEGLHLFLTVRNLRVLNYLSATRFKRRYIYPVGYGLPAIVVAASAATRPDGYGTEKHCWLNTTRGFIWSFIGPVCVIILINLIFFLITLWTLRKRLASLNADVTAIKNTRLMTFKALAHVCILGCTWGLGLLQAQGGEVVAFIFTIVNSLQGAFIFLVHCVLNRQVTEQYRRWFRVLGQSWKPQETPTTEMRITYVTEGERSQSHSAEGCTWEK